jgi:predicted GNAT family acetyltransferase
MHIIHYDDIEAFAALTEPYFARHEAEHNLQLGILSLLRRGLAHFGAPPYLAVIEDQGEVVALVLRTPPHNAIVSLIQPPDLIAPAVALLADDLHVLYGDDLPGVLGPAAEARALVEAWQQVTGRPAEKAIAERIYQLDTVIPVTNVAGGMHRASESDRALLEAWIAAFSAEALGEREHIDPPSWVEEALSAPASARGLYLWEDAAGQPVAFAGYTGPTPHGMRIGPVYTPPERRGHGYASALTAAVSQMLLDGGRQFCFLFTNLANPTSNKIYQQIGYRSVCDVDMWRFA